MTEDEVRKVQLVMVTSWPQRELSRPERDLWAADLRGRSFEDAMTAVMQCRKRLDWLPTAHQFDEEYQYAVGCRRDAERDQQRALMEAAAAPPDSVIAKQAIAEIRQQLAGARGPLARDLRDEFGR